MLRSLVPIWKLKTQFKNCSLLYYFPIFGGFQQQMYQSLKKYGDTLEFLRISIFNNPQLKFMFSNYNTQPLVIILDPEYNQEILAHSQKNYITKYNPIPHSLLINIYTPNIKDQFWINNHRQLHQIFSEKHCYNYIKDINQIIDIHLNQEYDPFIYHFTQSLISKITIKIIFGQNNEQLYSIITNILNLSNEINQKYKNSDNVIQSIFFKPINNSKVNQIKTYIDTLEQICQQIITNSQLNQSLLIPYCKEVLQEKKLSQKEVSQLLITIIFSMIDSLSPMIAHCILYLGLDKQAQKELYKEQLYIKSHNENLTLAKNSILNAFIQEVQRFRNPIYSAQMRQVTTSHYVKDLRLEKGWYIFQPLQVPLFNETYVTNPKEFDYTRWLTVSPIKFDNDYIFIPFSAGQRSCVGEQLASLIIKLIMSQIIRKFKVETITDDLQWIDFENFNLLKHDENLVRFAQRV